MIASTARVCSGMRATYRCRHAHLDNKIAAVSAWLFQNLFHTRARWRKCSEAREQSSPFAGILIKPSSGLEPEPLLTMELLTQPVATGRNGFGLISALPRAVDLPLIATGCNHGAP